MVVAVSGASLVGDPGAAFTRSFRQTQQFEAQQQQQQAGQQRQQELQRLAAIAFGTGPQQQVSQQEQLLAGTVAPIGQRQQFQAGQPQQPISPQQAQLTGQVGQAPALSKEEALRQLFVLSPDLGAKVFQGIGAVSERQREDAARRALEIESASPDQRAAIIQRQATELRSQGRDPRDTESLLEQTPEQQDASLATIRLAALSEKGRIAARPKPIKPTTFVQNLLAEGLVRGTPEFTEALRKERLRERGQRISISLGEKVETAEQVGAAKGRVRAFDALQEKATVAQEQLGVLEIIRSLDVTTGAIEPAKQAVARFAEGFGVPLSVVNKFIADPSAGGAFIALTGKLVLRVLEGQKGPQTDNDRKEIRKTIISLGGTPEANAFIADAAEGLTLRVIEQADFTRRFFAREGTFLGAPDEWNKFKKDTPMISKFVKTEAGLPVFFHRFQETLRRDNPGISDVQILEDWRQLEQSEKEKAQAAK